MASLQLKNIGKTYPNGFVAVKDFNLENRINVIFGDALEVEINGSYDSNFVF